MRKSAERLKAIYYLKRHVEKVLAAGQCICTHMQTGEGDFFWGGGVYKTPRGYIKEDLSSARWLSKLHYPLFSRAKMSNRKFTLAADKSARAFDVHAALNHMQLHHRLMGLAPGEHEDYGFEGVHVVRHDLSICVSPRGKSVTPEYQIWTLPLLLNRTKSWNSSSHVGFSVHWLHIIHSSF